MSELPLDYLVGLVNELRKLPAEAEWVEFKTNNEDPHEIGEYISALANSAALLGKTKAYLVWGIDDVAHDLVGTSFSPAGKKIGSEIFENWVLQRLNPKINFRFYQFSIENAPIVLLEIDAIRQETGLFSDLATQGPTGNPVQRLGTNRNSERANWGERVCLRVRRAYLFHNRHDPLQ